MFGTPLRIFLPCFVGVILVMTRDRKPWRNALHAVAWLSGDHEDRPYGMEPGIAVRAHRMTRDRKWHQSPES